MYRFLLLLCLVGCALANCPDCLTVTNNKPLTPGKFNKTNKRSKIRLSVCAQCAHNDLIFILNQSQSILASNQYSKVY